MFSWGKSKNNNENQEPNDKKKKRNSQVSLEAPSISTTPNTPDTPNTLIGSPTYPTHAKETSGASLVSLEELQNNLAAAIQDNEALRKTLANHEQTIADQNLLLQAQGIENQEYQRIKKVTGEIDLTTLVTNLQAENRTLAQAIEQEKRELAQKFEGLDRIMFDKLAAKAGEIQHSVALNIYNHVSNSIIGIFPFTGTAYSNMANAVVDDLKKIIERSFSVSEVREIVTKYEAEIQKKLLVIRNYMSEEQKKNDKIADLEKQLREAKDEIVALKQQIEIQVNNQQLQAQVQIPPKNNN